MHLTFKYDPAKEVDTLRVALGGIHNSKPVAFGLEAQSAGIDIASEEEVTRFCLEKIEREEIDMPARIIQCQELWTPHEKIIADCFGQLFDSNFDLGEVTTYLSLSQRFPYNYAERYFFVGEKPIKTALHELMHFYTLAILEPSFRNARESFEAFKEAVTVLLNPVFEKLMESKDEGYPQHQELRRWILKNWEDGKSLNQITDEYLASRQL